MPAFVACNENKAAFTKKQLRLYLAGQDRIRRPVGELPFWVFCAPILWRRCVGTDFSGFVRIWTKAGRFCGPKAK